MKKIEINIEDMINDIIDDFVLMLQKVRIEKKISQYRLSKITGLSHTTIMRIENFATTPSLTALIKIASALGMEIALCSSDYSENAIEQESISKGKLSEESSLAKIPEGEFIADTSDKRYVYITPTCDNKMYLDIREAIQFKIEAKEYLNTVSQCLQTYLDTLRGHSLLNEFVDSIERFSNSMILVLHEYYLGQHTSAYDLFAETMSNIDVDYLYCDLPSTQKFYRARALDKKIQFQKDDFFHVPFERRIQVSSQRYSFPGLPCLYVGSSMEVCFQELNCDRHGVALAEIRLHGDKSCRVLDLTKIFNTQMELMSTCEQMYFLKLFPLVFLCSTEIQQDRGSDTKEPKFRPDYVIPQLLLEYILDRTTWDKSPIFGIKYYSVKDDFFSEWLNGNTQKLLTKINVAIPVRTDGSHGYCSTLQELFYIDQIIE